MSSRTTRASAKRTAKQESQGDHASSSTSAQAVPNLSNASSIHVTTATITSNPLSTPGTTTSNEPVNDGHNLALTNLEAATAEARRTLIRGHQAARYAHIVASGAEPDLNNPAEVRHFEVDSYGSITLIVFEDGGAVWRLREVEADSNDKGTMIVGRFYVVTRL